jgi:hypothetical protein
VFEVLVLVLCLKTGGPTSPCVSVRCPGVKCNSDSTNLAPVLFFSNPFLVASLKLECRIVGSKSDSVVHIQP